MADNAIRIIDGRTYTVTELPTVFPNPKRDFIGVPGIKRRASKAKQRRLAVSLGSRKP